MPVVLSLSPMLISISLSLSSQCPLLFLLLNDLSSKFGVNTHGAVVVAYPIYNGGSVESSEGSPVFPLSMTKGVILIRK